MMITTRGCSNDYEGGILIITSARYSNDYEDMVL